MLFIVIILTSCGAAPVSSSNTKKEYSENGSIPAKVQYGVITASYRVYRNAQDVIEWKGYSDTVIFTGKIIETTFQVLDENPIEGIEEQQRRLYTFYNVDIINTYKGTVNVSYEEGKSKTTQIRMLVGVKNYRVEEQLRLIKEMNAKSSDIIFVLENAPEIKLGETYLFICGQYEKNMPSLINLDQSVYNLRDPFKKNTLSNCGLEKPEDYYTKSEDEYGNPLISAKDIISYFGKWDEFWAQWQKDNPDWETWLDKAAVEKALAQ